MRGHGLADYRTHKCDGCDRNTLLRYLGPNSDYTAMLCPNCRAALAEPTPTSHQEKP